VLLPVFKDGRLIAYTSMFGHQSDIGGKVPGSMPIDATSIFQEGVRIPPVKIWKKGEYNEDLIKLVMHQVRTPDWCKADLNALIASCRVAARRVIEMAERFGDDVFVSATDELLARNHRAMKPVDRPGDQRRQGQLRRLYLRRWHGLWPVQDQMHDVARGRPCARFQRHRSAKPGASINMFC
jgi:N-methylhydantoinase B/oxoprolinase/acetone carboxylase alpha subunit